MTPDLRGLTPVAVRLWSELAQPEPELAIYGQAPVENWLDLLARCQARARAAEGKRLPPVAPSPPPTRKELARERRAIEQQAAASVMASLFPFVPPSEGIPLPP